MIKGSTLSPSKLESSLATFYSEDDKLKVFDELDTGSDANGDESVKNTMSKLPKTLDQVQKKVSNKKKRARTTNKALSDTHCQTANRLEQRDVLRNTKIHKWDKEHSTSPWANTNDDEPDLFDTPAFQCPQKAQEEDVPFESETSNWPITQLHEYELDAKDEEAALFFRHLDQNNHIANELIGQIPTQTETLAYVAQHEKKEQTLWLQASQGQILKRGKGKWPKVPQVTRAYVMRFACEPNPTVQWERPCSNQHCETLRLFGWRAREFILPSDMMQIMSAVKNKKPVPLSPIVGWCVLCHYAHTNSLYFTALCRIEEKRQKDGIKDANIASQIFQIHLFSFPVDRIGEYRLSQCLVGDSEPMGLFGCFPIYNCNHYVESKVPLSYGKETKYLRVWRETDQMVFQQAQAALETNKSSTNTLGGTGTVASTPFGPTTSQ